MTNERTDLRPIDCLVLEFPGSRMTGEGLPILADLVERGLIRILDLVFVHRDRDGSTTLLNIADLGADESLDLTMFAGASSGLLGHDHIEDAAAAMRAGSSAAVLLYENRRAAPNPHWTHRLSRAARRTGSPEEARG